MAKRLKSLPTPSLLEAGLIWWYDYFNQKMYVVTRPELVELCTQNGGQILGLEANVILHQENGDYHVRLLPVVLGHLWERPLRMGGVGTHCRQ